MMPTTKHNGSLFSVCACVCVRVCACMRACVGYCRICSYILYKTTTEETVNRFVVLSKCLQAYATMSFGL